MLEEITMDYHAFRKDQVLTDTQLNELINYFEDQDRLTRTCLVGVGLVCGLSITYNATEASITVGRGCGVTTDGDLLTMETTAFRHFRAYTNRKKGTNDPIYDPFFPATDGGQQIELWELVLPDATNALPEDARLLTDFNAVANKVPDDLVALLYLEYYLKDPDKCTAIDCDNQGPHQLATIKVLLLSKASMDKVINRDPVNEKIADSIFKKYNESGSSYFDLPLLKAKRVILNSSNTSSISALVKSYTGIVQTGGSALISALDKLYSAFKFIVDPAGSVNLPQLKQVLQQALASNPSPYQAQYFYDYYKDLITGYNELRELLFHCMSECCPDKWAFPKHIMLGELESSGAAPAPYRHDFYPSPAIADGRDKLAKCRSQWRRLQQLIQSFEVPAQPADIKVTPSTDYDRCLADRALPFYYKNAADIVKSWSWELSRRGASNSVPGYRSATYAAGIDSTLNPLDYSIDQNNFFRIEGHLGKQLGAAMSGIDKIRNDKSIPFELVAVRLNKAGNIKDINADDFDCQFDDLNAVLKAWLVEQNCLYANITRFFSGFSTNRDAGFHVRLDDYRAVATPMMSATAVGLFTGRTAAQPAIGVLTLNTTAATGATSTSPICKTIYTVDTTISDNLEITNNALGLQFAEAVKTPNISGDDMIAQVKYRTASDPNLSKLNAEEREVVYDTPVSLVAYTYEISSLKPYTVNEISTTVLEKYMQRIERLCAYVKKLSSRMESIFSSAAYAKRGFESYYLFMIQSLIANCCAAEKLQSLLDEIEKRKQKILDSLLFANYARQHSGLEHKAGVHRGGTFVLVYARELRLSTRQFLLSNAAVNLTGAADPAATRVAAESPEASGATIENSPAAYSVYNNIDSFAYYLVANQGKLNFDAEVATYQRIHSIKTGSLAEQLFNRELAAKIKEICARLGQEEEAAVAANTVIADFCLPYLCCSDCPPITFIMPKQTYNLALPKAAACNDEELLEFRKEPAAGSVKAAAGFEATVANNADGRSFFDPKKVPEAGLGKEIGFTIDGQVTDCRITVMKHPAAKFIFRITDESDAVIAVTFINQSDDATGNAYTYEWDFSDGRPVQKVTSKNDITITYKKALLDQLGLNGTIPIKLVAGNGPCSNTVTDFVPYQKVVPVSLSLPRQLICNDEAPIPFTVQPADGKIASATEPDTVVAAGNLFDPSKTRILGQPIDFTVNGKPTTCRITVLPHPAPAFDTQPALTANNQMVVLFTNTTAQQAGQTLTYTWKFSDGTGKTTTDNQPFRQVFNLDVLRNMGQTELTVALRAANSACAGSIEKKIPFPAPPQATCADVVTGIINTDLQYFSSPEMIAFLNQLQSSNPTLFPLVAAVVKEVTALLTDARSNVLKFNDPAIQLKFMIAVKTELEKLYATQFDKKINDMIIAPAIAAMFRLALDIVRCVAEISGNVKEQLQGGIINRFITLLPNLPPARFPALNKDQNVVTFLDAWLNNTELQDQQIKDAVKRMETAVAANFPA